MMQKAVYVRSSANVPERYIISPHITSVLFGTHDKQGLPPQAGLAASVVYWLACWPLVPKIVDFSGEKIHSVPFFGGEVKPSVADLRHVKEPCDLYGSRNPQEKLTGHFSPNSVLH
jgi:hypothetical protein